MKKQFYLIIILIVTARHVFGQVITCDKEVIQRAENKFLKAEKKNKQINREFADMAFQIAECYRQKNDSVSVHWYLKTVEIQKGLYIYYKKSSDKIFALKRTALSYYYAKQYKDAVVYFNKITNCPKTNEQIECLYFQGLSYIQLGQPKDALDYLKWYKNTGDHKYNVDSLITSFEVKVNNE